MNIDSVFTPHIFTHYYNITSFRFVALFCTQFSFLVNYTPVNNIIYFAYNTTISLEDSCFCMNDLYTNVTKMTVCICSNKPNPAALNNNKTVVNGNNNSNGEPTVPLGGKSCESCNGKQ